MSTQTAPTADTSPSPWIAAAKAVALLTVAISVLLTAFAWPSVRSSLHDVPIAVAGPPAAVKQITATLDQRRFPAVSRSLKLPTPPPPNG